MVARPQSSWAALAARIHSNSHCSWALRCLSGLPAACQGVDGLIQRMRGGSDGGGALHLHPPCPFGCWPPLERQVGRAPPSRRFSASPWHTGLCGSCVWHRGPNRASGEPEWLGIRGGAAVGGSGPFLAASFSRCGSICIESVTEVLECCLARQKAASLGTDRCRNAVGARNSETPSV